MVESNGREYGWKHRPEVMWTEVDVFCVDTLVGLGAAQREGVGGGEGQVLGLGP